MLFFGVYNIHWKSIFQPGWKDGESTLLSSVISVIIAQLEIGGGSRYIFHVFSVITWENLEGVVREDRITTRPGFTQ